MTEIINTLVKIHFPERVWRKTKNGWHSERPTSEDMWARRNWVIKHYQNKYPEVLNETT